MPTAQELVTPAVAAIGLGLSIYNTVQARRDRRPKLRIRVSFGFLTDGPELSDQKILFEVGNAWNQSVTLASMCIPLPGKRSLTFFQLDGERQMPVVLTPGISTRFWLNSDQLEAETIKAGVGRHEKFRVMARDALGNEYLSNSTSFKPMK
jgi:hypothetical protein